MEDPTGKNDTVFLDTIHRIEEKILDLKSRLASQSDTLAVKPVKV